MSRYTQTIIDLERAQARASGTGQAAPSAAAIIAGAVVALCAVVALVLVFFTV